MGKTILVTGKDTFLGNEIAQFFLNQGHNVSASVTARKEVASSLDPEKHQFTFPLNRASAFSAKNFILQTVHEFSSLDEAWLLFSPTREVASIVELTPVEIEEMVDEQIKGFLFLLREVLAYQVQNPTFAVHLVLFDESVETLPPLAAFQYHGLRTALTSILHASKKKNLPVWGYESNLPQADVFASYILNHPRGVESKSAGPGKWYVLGEKKALFPWLGKKD